ncbi:MAG: putative transposase [Candidatus Promineifilaceae bacterium]|jgi:putative transposase
MEVTQIHETSGAYYFTFTTIHWLPVFVSAEACLILTNSLNFCHESKHLRINAFVIMPTHCHLILFDANFDQERLRKTIAAMRQFTGRQLIELSEKKMPSVFGQVMNSPNRTDRSRQFWQQSKHPVAIWSQPFWQTKFNYLHNNPVRKGLVRESQDWRFSSANYWQGGRGQECDVILTSLEW